MRSQRDDSVNSHPISAEETIEAGRDGRRRGLWQLDRAVKRVAARWRIVDPKVGVDNGTIGPRMGSRLDAGRHRHAVDPRGGLGLAGHSPEARRGLGGCAKPLKNLALDRGLPRP